MQQAQQQFLKCSRDCICRKPGRIINFRPISDTYGFSQEVALPLIKIEYQVSIQNNISETQIIQVYKNETDKYIDTEYTFPIRPDSCFTQFKAEFNKTIIHGVIKEKGQAKKEYKEHKNQGNTVGLTQVSKEMPDVMKTEIANIPAQQEIKITLTFTEELSNSMNQFWLYKIPIEWRPRFCLGEPENAEFSTIKKYNFYADTKIVIKIKSESEIEFLRSPSHSFIDKFYQIDNKKEVLLELNNFQLNKDFVLLYRDTSINKPQVLLGHNDIQSCAQITFIPDFNSMDKDDAFLAMSQEKEKNGFKVDMAKAQAEFIFLIDRSGSMSGARMEEAKNALKIFIQSLPVGSFFNVVSFGSRHELMFPQSQPYDQETMQEALNQISSYKADFAGTIIHTPLEAIFNQNKIPFMSRQVFLLTDGSVSQPEKVLNVIKYSIQDSRLHSIGIGSGCSEYLVKESAKAGKGKSIFIKDNEDPVGQVIDLLQSSLTPVLDEIELVYDYDLVENVVPNPKNMPVIMKNEPFTMYFYFKPGVLVEDLDTMVQLQCYDSSQGQNMKYTIPVNNNCQVNQNVFKMGIYKTIQSLQNIEIDNDNNDYLRIKNQRNNNNKEYGKYQNVLYAKEIDPKKEAIKLSVDNQVLSTYTAFLCVIQELDDQQKAQFKEEKESQILQKIEQEQQQYRKDINFVGYTYQQQQQYQYQPQTGSRQHSGSLMNQLQSQISGRFKQIRKQDSSSSNSIYSDNYSDSDDDDFEEEDCNFRNNNNNDNRNYQKPSLQLGIKQAYNELRQDLQKEDEDEDDEDEIEQISEDKCQIYNQNRNNNINSNKKKKKNKKKKVEKKQQNWEMDYDQQMELEKEKEKGKNTFKILQEAEEKEKFEQQQQQQQQQPKSDKNLIQKIILCQQFNGQWEASQNLLGFLKIDQQKFLQNIPSNLGNEQIKENLWATIIVIFWLEKFCLDNKSTWQMVVDKAEIWLKQQLKNKYDQKSYNQFIEQILN